HARPLVLCGQIALAVGSRRLVRGLLLRRLLLRRLLLGWLLLSWLLRRLLLGWLLRRLLGRRLVDVHIDRTRNLDVRTTWLLLGRNVYVGLARRRTAGEPCG